MPTKPSKPNGRPRSPRLPNGRRDWDRTISLLNTHGPLTFHLSSPGVAQVVRCRLLATYTNLLARTKGRTLFLSLRP